MLYSQVFDEQVSRIAFGAMRLPLLEDGQIDAAQVDAMVDACMDAGINYFDTAYPYHGGLSEVVLGKSLARYPRETWKLANKYPGHQIAKTYDVAAVFEDQLAKCGVEYFDYYLLHNVYENCAEDVYLNPEYNIIGYLKEQKAAGRIKHLGFSTHAQLPCLEKFLEAAGEDMDFCQIQLNWLDYTLQKADKKIALCAKYDLPIIVMEPMRGGKLCDLGDENNARLKALRPDVSIASWSLNWLISQPEADIILTGASSLEQLQENIELFQNPAPLNADERALLASIAADMDNMVGCTGCGYCLSACPHGLNIPLFMDLANDALFAPSSNAVMTVESLPEEKRPTACFRCGECSAMCPQGIDIPGYIRKFLDIQAKLPSWIDISKQREEAARKLREQGK